VEAESSAAATGAFAATDVGPEVDTGVPHLMQTLAVGRRLEPQLVHSMLAKPDGIF
jgi:hypothetical protein